MIGDLIRERNCVGQRAIYRATGFLIPVTITEILFEPHFEAKLMVVDNIILTFDQRMPKTQTEFSVGAAWDYLRVDADSWSFAQSGCVWRVLLNEGACEAVLRLCREKAGLNPEILFQLADYVCGIPGIQDDIAAFSEIERKVTESVHRRNNNAELSARIHASRKGKA